MKRVCLVVALLAPASAVRGEGPADAVKAAVEKGLRRIETGAANYTENRQCFSCHHTAMPLLSLTAARQRGFAVEVAKVEHQVEFTLNTFRSKKEQVAKGQGVPGSNTTTAYALYALAAAGHPADDTTAALVEFLLLRQRA